MALVNIIPNPKPPSFPSPLTQLHASLFKIPNWPYG